MSALTSKAEETVSKDPDFKSQVIKAIESRSLKQTLELCCQKALEQKDSMEISNPDLPGFAYQMFLVVFPESKVPENMRNSMMVTVEAKLKDLIPNLLNSNSQSVSNSPPVSPKLHEISTPVPETASNSIPQNNVVPDPDRIDRSTASSSLFPNAIGAPIPRTAPRSATSSAPTPVSNRTVEVNKSVQVTCNKCKWLFSSRNETCPMCGAAIMLGEDALIKILEEYVDRQGLTIDPKEAKEFTYAYKKKFRKLPSLDDLWNAAVQLAKLESMNESQLKKKQEDKAQREKLNLQGEMERLKDKKIKEKEDVEAEKRKQEELRKKAEEDKKRREAEAKASKMVQIITCKKCGVKNPADSKFCLECGGKLG